jgi:hypothetical protein
MKPIFTSFFSGASEPAAQAPTRTASGTIPSSPAAPALFRKLLLSALIRIAPKKTRKALAHPFTDARTPLFNERAVALLRCYAANSMPSLRFFTNQSLDV